MPESPGSRALETPPPIAPALLEIPIGQLEENPFQPRFSLNEETLAELTESIRSRGVLQPILVRKKDDGPGYTVIAGHRRLAAARKAGLTAMPARLVQAQTREMLELALIENLQRDALNPIEEAHAYQSLMEEMNYTQEDVAARVGKARATIANALRLLTLPEPVQEALADNLIDAGHARALLAMGDARLQLTTLDIILQKGLSVREAESLAKTVRNETAPKPKAKAKIPVAPDPHLRDMERQLRTRLGTKVTILPPRGGKGKIEIEFYQDQDLERILGILGVRFGGV